MQFGIITVGDVTTDPATGRAPSEHQRIKNTVEMAVTAEQLGLDFYNANQLETAVVDGSEVLTGRVVGTVVDRDQKARDLLRFADESGVDPAMSVAVGDGANDLGMFAAAGLSVAYCAKPVTAAAADVAIGFPRLDAVAAFAFRTD